MALIKVELRLEPWLASSPSQNQILSCLAKFASWCLMKNSWKLLLVLQLTKLQKQYYCYMKKGKQPNTQLMPLYKITTCVYMNGET
jgi:hypothetical protein